MLSLSRAFSCSVRFLTHQSTAAAVGGGIGSAPIGVALLIVLAYQRARLRTMTTLTTIAATQAPAAAPAPSALSTSSSAGGWRSLGVSPAELRCDVTLVNGQCFGWAPDADAPRSQWTGVLANKVVTIQQTACDVLFRTHPSSNDAAFESHFRQYLRLDPLPLPASAAITAITATPSPSLQLMMPVDESTATTTTKTNARSNSKATRARTAETDPSSSSSSCVSSSGSSASSSLLSSACSLSSPPISLSQLYTEWSVNDPRFAKIGSHFTGVRLLRQDPVECLFSFLCSSNNNIGRITKMLNALRRHYGELVAEIDGVKYYSFPSVDALCKISEQDLRTLGFGYRAAFIVRSAQTVQQNGGDLWLHSLRTQPRQQVQEALCSLHGVGRKVADCVALFSLDQLDCVPVDVHVFAIACRDYRDSFRHLAGKNTSMTKKVYDEVGEFFRGKFGPYAGWAHSVLFTADLAAFQDRLPSTLQRSPSKLKQARVKTTKKNKNEADGQEMAGGEDISVEERLDDNDVAGGAPDASEKAFNKPGSISISESSNGNNQPATTKRKTATSTATLTTTATTNTPTPNKSRKTAVGTTPSSSPSSSSSSNTVTKISSQTMGMTVKPMKQQPPGRRNAKRRGAI